MRRMHALGISIAGLLLAASAWASAARPVAVSPGSTVGTTVISERCPTFSWGAVEGADTYDLVVYRVAPDARLGEPEPGVFWEAARSGSGRASRIWARRAKGGAWRQA